MAKSLSPIRHYKCNKESKQNVMNKVDELSLNMPFVQLNRFFDIPQFLKKLTIKQTKVHFNRVKSSFYQRLMTLMLMLESNESIFLKNSERKFSFVFLVIKVSKSLSSLKMILVLVELIKINKIQDLLILPSFYAMIRKNNRN